MKIWQVLFFSFLPCLGLSQTITVSEDLPLRNDVAYEIIGELGGRLLLFRDQAGNDFQIQAFNTQMREVWSKPLELDKKQPRVLSIPAGRESFSVIYRFRENNHTKIKIHKYDPAANLVDSLTVKDFGYLFYTPDFQVVVSENQQKALVYYLDKQTVFRTFTIDIPSMELLWEKTFDLEDFNYWENFEQVLVDNDGNMHLILSKNNYNVRKNVHYYEFHEYFGAGDLEQFNISLDGMLTYDVVFTYDNLNKSLVAGGLFAEKNNGKANGFFFLSIPEGRPDDHVLRFHEFDNEFLSSLLGKEVDENKGISELIIQELVLRRDGGAIIITERTRQTERRMAGTNRVFFDGRSSLIVDYYYDELCLIALHPDGNLHWTNILHKKQYSQDDDAVYSSYFLHKSSTSLRFLFNDEIRYENTVSEYVINSLGEYERNSLLSTENLKLRLRFRDALQIAADEVIVPSERRNRLRLVKLEY